MAMMYLIFADSTSSLGVAAVSLVAGIAHCHCEVCNMLPASYVLDIYTLVYCD